MNLPAHIKPCSPPSMNLLAYCIESNDPSIASLRTNDTCNHCLQRYCLALPKRRQGKILRKLPGGTSPLPGAWLQSDPLS
ncbi:hypothetical protein DEO72_LG4g754 [Vigna unguiculata]|uniref:Uncharacterized protein n=1 Tax=Vigna unguiculata TaxID=3917 RepID=A0A4D6LP52_VIGUN|nr:hypothetical protein DEO72_LG4g754 [Vigna unguiculata]